MSGCRISFLAILLSMAVSMVLVSAIAIASGDLSGRWKISYVVQSGGPDEQLAKGSVVSLSEKDATLQGRATLGSRGDGYLIGVCEGGTFRAAVTFRHNPSMFLRMAGICVGDNIQGTFTASQGGFLAGELHSHPCDHWCRRNS